MFREGTTREAHRPGNGSSDNITTSPPKREGGPQPDDNPLPTVKEALVKDLGVSYATNPEALAMLRQETTREAHLHKNGNDSDNITIKPERGTSKAYTLELWRKATTGEHGGDRKSNGAIKSDNISLDPKRGTSKAYTLDRLKNQRPDLFEPVVAKELSANAAAKMAGWRKETSALETLRKATAAPVGTNQHNNNVITLKSKQGNSRAYLLERILGKFALEAGARSTMRKNSVSSTGEGQSPIDFSGCSFVPIPGTRIRLVIPSHEAELRLSVELGVADRFKGIRADALRNLTADAEAFAQKNFGLGNGLYLSVSLLTSRQRWAGGWLLFHAPAGTETDLIEYIYVARDAVVADLRQERATHGSKS
jgi:hypothetical protein